MFTVVFWRDAVERAIKTAAQAGIAVFVAGVTVTSVDWGDAGAVVGTAVLVSLLGSVASTRVGSPTSASLIE